jgi:hypothetical protein
MGMVDHNFRGIDHPFTRVKPSITEISIFSCGKRKRGIKAASGAKKVCRHRQIIRGEKMCIARIKVVALIEVVDEEMGS